MATIEQLKEEIKELSNTIYKEWDCHHAERELRFDDYGNGQKAYFWQCVKCGGKGSAAAKASLTPQQIQSAPPVDTELSSNYQRDRFEDKIRRLKPLEDQIKKLTQAGNKEWWKWYDNYLLSPQWQAKRQKVLERCGGICEGCGERPAYQVHHLTYDRVGEEMLFDLVAVCLECHRRIHPDKELG